VFEKSREEQVNVPVGSIQKARRLLRASGLQKCVCKGASWYALALARTLKWKSWLIR
jgi:hypothetical protein